MYNKSIKLIEMPDLNQIAVCVYNEDDGLFQLGERINAVYAEAYMNGYNWDALIRFYVERAEPGLMAAINTDPEAGSFAAYIPLSADNREKMVRFKSHIEALVSNESALMQLIETHRTAIEWD